MKEFQKEKQHIAAKNHTQIVAPQEPLDFLVAELAWLKKLIEARFLELYEEEANAAALALESMPPVVGKSAYTQVIATYCLGIEDRLLLALALAVDYDQSIFKVWTSLGQGARLSPEIGGHYDPVKNVFKPSIQTALFLLSGVNKMKRAAHTAQFVAGSILIKEQIVYIEDDHFMQGGLSLEKAYFRYLLTGAPPKLDDGKYFPARLDRSAHTLDDLIIDDRILTTLKPITNYVNSMKNGFFTQGKHLFKKGFIGLFYGVPGTGKTMLAGALANTYGIDMYRVDLSQVVSKYIGETEKNLEVLFDRLEGKNCMLFFDEADALFGKRSEVQDAQDRYANQEVSYLLQRIEKFDGLVILATNFENNLDAAFKRRINVMINMIKPSENERVRLWKHYLPEGINFGSDDLLKYLTKEFGYTGANIRNVMEMVAQDMFEQKETTITFELIKPYLLIENIKVFGINRAQLSNPARYNL